MVNGVCIVPDIDMSIESAKIDFSFAFPFSGHVYIMIMKIVVSN